MIKHTPLPAKNPAIAVIGLGYVGLPLAVEFAKKFTVTGFDINVGRISELNAGHDSTLEVEDEKLKSVLQLAVGSKQLAVGRGQQAVGSVQLKVGSRQLAVGSDKHETGLVITGNSDLLKRCNVFIITVPTPVDRNNRPDLTPLVKASETVGHAVSKGAVVIYESTVFPGCTEEDCIPVIQKTSGLKYNVDFYAGYSPERINPGDKEHTFSTIRKVTSGSTPQVADFVDALYNTVVKAGTFKASSIKVAEMAKVIENSQRDINIAFVNEIARICSHFRIDTHEVLEAAATKWNFLKFKPGLVGGHCIGVDPYYLAQKAQECGYHPEIILAGRRMNDTMGAWIAGQVIKLMIKQDIPVNNSKVLVLGITFKENCPDIRNSKVIDVIRELKDFGCRVDTFDPWANPAEVKHEYDIDLLKERYDKKVGSRQLAVGSCYDCIILAVAHDVFKQVDLNSLRKEQSVIYDIKGIIDRETVTGRV